MPIRYQKTISGEVSLEGIGLHTGIKSTLTIKPAKENAGIIFVRTDLDGNPIIPAKIDYVIDTNRGTVLEREGVRIHTVEHVLAALRGLAVDNVIIELSGPEPPIMDGSALPFVRAIKNVGIVDQNATQDVIKITEPIQFNGLDNDVEINVLPADHFKTTYFMDYGLPKFGLQYSSIENVECEFEKEIAPARTFGLLSEVAQLKKDGLIKGGSLDNSVVIIDKKVDKNEQKLLSKLFGLKTQLTFNEGDILNNEGLYFDNEPVRHKVLDLIGDMALLGKPLEGHIIATKSGHSANIELVKTIKQKMGL